MKIDPQLLEGLDEKTRAFVEDIEKWWQEEHRDKVSCANAEHYETVVLFLKNLNRTPNQKDLLLFHAQTELSVSVKIFDDFGRVLCITQYGIYESQGNDSLDHVDDGLPPSGLYEEHPELIRRRFDARVYLNVTLITRDRQGRFLLVRDVPPSKIRMMLGECERPTEDKFDEAQLERLDVYELTQTYKSNRR